MQVKHNIFYSDIWEKEQTMNTELRTRIRAILLTVILLLLLEVQATSVGDSQSKETNKVERVDIARSLSRLAEILKFQQFKRLFKKVYTTLQEETIRAKLYLARSCQATISAICFKYRRCSSFLRINRFSDRTSNELRRLFINQKRPKENQLISGEQQVQVVPDIQVKEVDKLDSRGGMRKVSLVSLLLPRVAVDGEVMIRVEQQDDLFDVPAPKMGNMKPTFWPEKSGEANSIQVEPRSLGNFVKLVQSGLSRLFNKQIPRGTQEKIETDKQGEKVDSIFIDHRESGCFPAIKDQGDCGTCATFASIAFYEWLYCRTTGAQTSFSEQYVLDCSPELGGCEGERIGKVSEKILERGFEFADEFPYLETPQTCPYSPSFEASAMGSIRLDFDQLPYRVIRPDSLDQGLSLGPVVVTVSVNEPFVQYGGGVDSLTSCSGDWSHAMLLVGGGREDGQDYWLFRNSYSEEFGEDGYYKMNKLSVKCIQYGLSLKQSYFNRLEKLERYR